MSSMKPPLRIACLSLMGVGISALIALVISAFEGDFLPTSQEAIATYGLIGGTLASYIAGAVICVGFYYLSMIFNLTRWSIGVRSLVHFISLYTLFLACFFGARWIPFTGSTETLIQLSFITVEFVGIYLVVWLISYHVEKNEAKKLNEKLK